MFHFFIIALVIDLIIYFVFLLRYRYSRKKGSFTPSSYEIFTCKDKITALRTSRLRAGWLYGAAYSGFFFFVLPILIWRYGTRTGVLLVSIPIVFGLIISVLTGAFGTADSLIIGFITSVILRPIVGMYIYINDRKLVISALLKRNWQSAGCQIAKSRKSAISLFSS